MSFYVSRSRTHFVVLNSFCNGIFAYFYIALQMTTSACVATETHAKMSQLKIAINSTPQHWAVFECNRMAQNRDICQCFLFSSFSYG